MAIAMGKGYRSEKKIGTHGTGKGQIRNFGYKFQVMPTPGPIFSPDTILQDMSAIIKNENTLNKLPDLNH